MGPGGLNCIFVVLDHLAPQDFTYESADLRSHRVAQQIANLVGRSWQNDARRHSDSKEEATSYVSLVGIASPQATWTFWICIGVPAATQSALNSSIRASTPITMPKECLACR